MTLSTDFTKLFGISHPIALAPMGGSAGGTLAAAVSNGGGLGLVGGGREDVTWIEHELGIVTAKTEKPWGIGFQSWSVSEDSVARALEFRPHVVMLSFGDPKRLAGLVRDAGLRLILQVTDLAEAKEAVDLGADVIVAQGMEAGGHSGKRTTLPFVPIVVDLAGGIPVLAAGGIADGRGVAAALALGAAGALIGTRFQVTPESMNSAQVTKAIIEGSGEQTERSRILDIAGRRETWPARYLARTVRNEFIDEWRGREDELEADDGAKARFREGADKGDPAAVPVWASESIDLITDIVPASELVGLLADEAEAALRRAGRAIRPTP
ncbi:MAG: nitronate monooxygenase [Acidimicrobiales bacterium]